MKKEANTAFCSLFVFSLLFTFIFAGTILSSGCSSKSKSESEAKSENGEENPGDEPEKNTQPPKFIAEFSEPDRDGMAGHWVFSVCMLAPPGNKLPSREHFFVVKMSPKENGEFAMEIVSTPKIAKFVLKSFKITDKDLKMKFVLIAQQPTKTKQKVETREILYRFEGLRTKNMIRSVIVTQPMIRSPLVGLFEAVSEIEISQIAPREPIKGFQRFFEINRTFQQTKNPKVLEEFLFSFEDSPLALIASGPIIQSFKALKYDEKNIQNISSQYLKIARLWGVKNQHQALRALCSTLIGFRYRPEMVIQFLKVLQQEISKEKSRYTDDELEALQNYSEDIMKIAVMLRDVEKVHFASKVERSEAAKSLEKNLQENSFHPLVLYALATHARREKDLNSAIDYYSRLMAIPDLNTILLSFWREDGIQSPPVDEILKKVWFQKHGTNDGLDANIQKVYEDTIFSFADTPIKLPKKKDRRNLLLELFTSSENKSSQATEIALGAIERSFPGEEVVVLRYHQHIAGADPLANTDSEARMSEYGLGRTLCILSNGKMSDRTSAPSMLAPRVYKKIKKQVEESLKLKTNLQIALEAKRAGDDITVDALVRGQEIDPDWRLVVALAEKRVDYKGANSLRFHEMVVRDILTRIDGNPFKNGKLQFQRKIRISELREDLDNNLTDFEKESNHEFLDKPFEMKNLYIVAFVQNYKTKEVLQVSRVKIAPAEATSPSLKKNEGASSKAKKTGKK